jgi:4a-hydroxytetrahydrobiopterin dehydratase
MTRLSEEQIAVHLGLLSDWHYDADSLHRTFRLGSFKEAAAFVQRVAVLAEQASHHPDIHLRYKQVEVTLSTRDSGGVTGKDFLLAQQIQSLEERHDQIYT